MSNKMNRFSAPGWPEDRIDATFKYHNPVDAEDKERTFVAYASIREAGREMAMGMSQFLPNSPESVRAINCIQEAVALANAAIAINGVRPGCSEPMYGVAMVPDPSVAMVPDPSVFPESGVGSDPLEVGDVLYYGVDGESREDMALAAAKILKYDKPFLENRFYVRVRNMSDSGENKNSYFSLTIRKDQPTSCTSIERSDLPEGVHELIK